MDFQDLPQEKQEALMMLGYRLEIEVEDDKRRQCTRFGYRFGGLSGLAASAGGTVFLAGILLVVLACVAPSLNTTMETSPLFWLCFTPLLLIPILPFVFFKPRYTVKPLIFIMVIFVVIALLSGLGTWAVGAIASALN